MCDAIGIDFGTTTTLVATRRGDVVSISKFGSVNRTYVSSDAVVVLGNRTVEILVGDKAEAWQGPDDNAFPLRAVKRHLACTEACAGWSIPAVTCRGDGTLSIRGASVSLVDIIGAIIAGAISSAGVNLHDADGPSGDVVLGCPSDADWSERQRIVAAARAAGLHDRLGAFPFANIREEPLLAAKSIPTFALLPPGRYLVIDVGGGSTDVAVMEYFGPGTSIQILATKGERFAGGYDVDRALYAIAVRRLGETTSFGSDEVEQLLSVDDRHLLERDIEVAKQTLGLVSDAEVSVLGETVPLTRVDLDTAVANSRLMRKVEALVRDVLRSTVRAAGMRNYNGVVPLPGDNYAGVTPDGVLRDLIPKMKLSELLSQIDFILLAGGGTKLAGFHDWLASHLGNHGRDGSMIVAPAGVPEPVERIVFGAASGVDVKLQSSHRLAYRFRVRDVDGGYREIIEPYARWSELSARFDASREDDAIEISSLQHDFTETIQLAWLGATSVEVNEVGMVKVASSTGVRDPEPVDGPWRSESQRNLEARIQADLDHKESDRKKQVARNTDPKYAYRHDVG